MRGIDLELCTRDGCTCKNWPTKELVPPNKFSSRVSWSVMERLAFQNLEDKKFVLALRLSACMKWVLNFVQEMGVRTELQGVGQPNKFSSWVSLSVKQTSLPNFRREEICFGPWTSCMHGMDLELCKRDGCKNWPTKELVSPNKFSSWVRDPWNRLVFQIVEKKKFVSALELSACVEWILNFVQEMDVRTEQQRSWFPQQILFLSFLICDAKTGLPKFRRQEICFGLSTVCMHGMDLELCTRNWCKNWATTELVPPNKFSSWVS